MVSPLRSAQGLRSDLWLRRGTSHCELPHGQDHQIGRALRWQWLLQEAHARSEGTEGEKEKLEALRQAWARQGEAGGGGGGRTKGTQDVAKVVAGAAGAGLVGAEKFAKGEGQHS